MWANVSPQFTEDQMYAIVYVRNLYIFTPGFAVKKVTSLFLEKKSICHFNNTIIMLYFINNF